MLTYLSEWGKVRCRSGMVRHGSARLGKVRSGIARYGGARYGQVRKEGMERNEIYLTGLERTVKAFLDMQGADYIAQYPLRTGYIADFAIPSLKIIIEVDGKRWHSSKKQRKKDRFRDYMLKREGWSTIRIKEDELDEINKILGGVLSLVATASASKKAKK